MGMRDVWRLLHTRKHEGVKINYYHHLVVLVRKYCCYYSGKYIDLVLRCVPFDSCELY